MDELSFDVQPGELFGVIGQNGSGKTTLFNILNTSCRPSHGEVRIMGLSTAAEPEPVRRKIGVVFQHPCLDRFLSVRENLFIHGRLYGLDGPSIRVRIGEELMRAGLSGRSGDRAGALSGGLRRRAELAKALLHQPDVLLMDEPTAALDPSARADFWSHLNELRQARHLTVLLTTHHMEEAERCDRLLMLDEGKSLAQGTPAALKKKVGSEVLSVSSQHPEKVVEVVRTRYGVEAQVVDGVVRFEVLHASTLVAGLAEALGEDASSITVSQPSLDDVFIKLTGHRFKGSTS